MKSAIRLLVPGVLALIALTAAWAAQPTAPPAAAAAADEPAKKADEPAKAADLAGSYKVDGVHSSNVFRIKHLDTAYFYGRFNDCDGEFTLDPADPDKCRFDIRLKVVSVDTANSGRDDHLRSEEYFDAEKHPQITFKSKSAKKAGGSALEVSGDLTLRGVTKPLTATVELTGSGKGFRGEFRAGWETTFTIKRSDFGMTAGQGALSDDVRITISVEGIKS